jgi:hypothetical protein
MPSPIEIIRDGDKVLAYIIKAQWMPEATTFVTPDEAQLQVGMIVYGAGQAIRPHLHLPATREVLYTAECILVRHGACMVDFYNQTKAFLATRELGCGDVILLLAGGHGFRMCEDTILLEVKQGPYVGLADKEKFDAR